MNIEQSRQNPAPFVKELLFAASALLFVPIAHASSDIARFDPNMALGGVVVTNGMKWR